MTVLIRSGELFFMSDRVDFPELYEGYSIVAWISILSALAFAFRVAERANRETSYETFQKRGNG